MSWRDQAACVGIDTELFFPSESTMYLAQRRELSRICGSCPVQPECLKEALDTRQMGWWGGTDDADRRKMRGATRRSVNHGTESMYRTHGCRCDRCKAAKTAAERKRRLRSAGIADDDPRHGTSAGYSAGCKCDGCKRAHRDDTRARREAQAS